MSRISSFDIDNNGGLDLSEFTTEPQMPSTPVKQFVKTLPIAGMLASSLVIPGAGDPLKTILKTSTSSVRTTNRELQDYQWRINDHRQEYLSS
jgi:hypothetical protein